MRSRGSCRARERGGDLLERAIVVRRLTNHARTPTAANARRRRASRGKNAWYADVSWRRADA